MQRLSPPQRWKAASIAAAGYPLLAVLGRTLRWRVDGLAHYESLARDGRAPILALWHGRIPAATLFWQRRGIVALTSENFDGEWVARLMARFGYAAARGSTSHGGARALVQLRRDLSSGRTAAFTVDGPRGPARVAQAGAVWLSAATGNPLLPFHIEADRAWTAGSWDRTQVPKPFSTVAIAIGPPLAVADTSDAVVEAGRRELESALRRLESRTLEMLRGHGARPQP
jgi:lysophospholipid acyltransferase (LPLAT)-like uncharacterized protein